MSIPPYSSGRHSYGSPEIIRFNEDEYCLVGNFCSFAAGTKMMPGGGHRMEWTTTFPFPAFHLKFSNPVLAEFKRTDYQPNRGNIRVGSDVWIGAEAMILSGAKIGHGAVIGARTVVSKDVPPYAVVAGSPARVLRYRFTSETIQRLLKLAWWNWNDAKINSMMSHFVGTPNMDKMEKESEEYDLVECKENPELASLYVGYGLEDMGLDDVTAVVRKLCIASTLKGGRVDIPAEDTARMVIFSCKDPYPGIFKHVFVKSKDYGCATYEVGKRIFIWKNGYHSQKDLFDATSPTDSIEKELKLDESKTSD